MESTLTKIEEFVLSSNLFSRDLNGQKKKILDELDLHATGLTIIINYDNLSPLYFSPAAKLFLGVDNQKTAFDFSHWSGLIHPVSQRYILESVNFFKDNPGEVYKGPLLMMAEPLHCFTWLYTQARIITLPNPQKTKLICLIATDIEKMIGCNGQDNDNQWHDTPLENTPLPIHLSGREQAIIKLMCEELTSKEIACRLSCSLATVEADRKKIMNKLGVKSMVGIVNYAFRSKIV